GAGLEHSSEIRCVVTVLAGSNVHPIRRAVTQQPESFEIVRRHRFFEPHHTVLREILGKAGRLLTTVRAVCIDEQLGPWADCDTRGADSLEIFIRSRADFHLYTG